MVQSFLYNDELTLLDVISCLRSLSRVNIHYARTVHHILKKFSGHETTSGMLTFSLYYLLKNPEAMRKLRQEVDEKIGDRPMTINDVHKLPYLIGSSPPYPGFMLVAESIRSRSSCHARGAAFESLRTSP